MKRNTRQREAIEMAFLNSQRPLSPQEALEKARTKVPKLGIATVYRQLSKLLEVEWLSTVALPGQPIRYERSGLHHHHHFHCDGCKKVFDLEAPNCKNQIEKASAPGFKFRTHEVIVYGLCPDCG